MANAAAASSSFEQTSAVRRDGQAVTRDEIAGGQPTRPAPTDVGSRDASESTMTWCGVGPPGDPGPTPVVVGGQRLLLVFGDGRWWAIEDRCSHANCAFTADGEIDGLVAVCNCHGSEFDIRSGEPLMMPATEPIRTFPARLRGGILEVEM